MPQAKIFVGTSGYSYKHWENDVFYPSGLNGKEMLEFYARHFSTVELNVTFYRLLQPAIFKSWYDRTPSNFKFALKGNRIITHYKKLRDYKDTLKIFLDSISKLQEKLLLVLWQFPANFKYDRDRIKNFTQTLKKEIGGNYLNAFEFRNQSWFNEELYQLLKEKNFSLCIADSPLWPLTEVITANFIYLRFHGGKVLYGSEYSRTELENWALKVKEWIKRYKIQNIFAYFNNDASGFAVKNALIFRELLVK